MRAEIAKLFRLGRANSEIAAQLGISVGTVKSNLHRMGLKRGPDYRSIRMTEAFTRKRAEAK